MSVFESPERLSALRASATKKSHNPVKAKHWHDFDCAVPDCTRKATGSARISINGARKKRLPLCDCHLDAAHEDTTDHALAARVPNKADLLDDLKKFHGLPPYDGINPCCGDGYFANALVRKHGMSMKEMEEAVGFDKLAREWSAMRASFACRSR